MNRPDHVEVRETNVRVLPGVRRHQRRSKTFHRDQNPPPAMRLGFAIRSYVSRSPFVFSEEKKGLQLQKNAKRNRQYIGYKWRAFQPIWALLTNPTSTFHACLGLKYPAMSGNLLGLKPLKKIIHPLTIFCPCD